MQVQEFMTTNPACCTQLTDLQEVAGLMVKHHCGAIPVVENEQNRKVVGIVTDRDIVCRILAEGNDPRDFTADDCMSSPVACVSPDTSIEECCQAMQEHQVRRIPVADPDGTLRGIVVQADIAARAEPSQLCDVIRAISEASARPAKV